jgi:rod shape-determining protein MreD
MLIFLYIGYVNGVANRVFYPDDIKFPILFISLSDLAYLFLTYFFGFLLRARFDIGYYFLHVILPEAAYTIVVATIVYIPLQRIIYRLKTFERESD